MKVYKGAYHIVDNYPGIFQQEVNRIIENNQMKGYQSEIQYSSCGMQHVCRYSALILAYTEE